MALVEYSDSEASDNEEESPPQLLQVKPSASSTHANAAQKPTFQKVVDRSNPRKIRVNLFDKQSNSKETDNAPTQDSTPDDEPPSKKAKTLGGDSGFNSFLPAPKNAGRSAANNATNGSASKSGGTGLKRGFSLKTGAAPTFSREPQNLSEPNEYGVGGATREEADVTTRSPATEKTEPTTTTLAKGEDDAKLTGKPTMFRPLSVSRGAQTKKKKKVIEGSLGAMTAKASKSTVGKGPPQTNSSSAVPSSAPKKSLFSTYSEESIPSGVSKAFDDEVDMSPPSHTNAASTNIDITTQHFASPPTTNTTTTTAAPTPQPTDLQTIADNLNLSAAERRQLFGRNGTAPASAAQVAQFSLGSEYSRNRELAESEAAAAVQQHNPVRSIAPGKHSLQQLINATASQQEALEESFAQGKQNRRAAGNRYGWK